MNQPEQQQPYKKQYCMRWLMLMVYTKHKEKFQKMMKEFFFFLINLLNFNFKFNNSQLFNTFLSVFTIITGSVFFYYIKI